MDTAIAISIAGDATLDALVVRMLDLQVFPALLPRENTEGSSKLGPPFVDACQRLVRFLTSATAPEIDAVASSMPAIYSMLFDVTRVKQREPAAIQRMALQWLAYLVTERTREGPLSPLAPLVGGRVWKRFEELRSHVTDEGLLDLCPDLHFSPGGVLFEGHIIHYHPWLGPGCSNSPESDLFARLCHHARSTDNAVAIGIDSRCYTPRTDYRAVVQKDYWRGRPFDRDDLDDPHKSGVTVHTAPAPETAPRVAAACLLSGIQRTEFFWKCKEGIKTFEAEEVVAPERGRRGRYLHAEYVLKDRHFRHLDGAVMLYTREDAQTRCAISNILPKTPRALKPKLFRIDGRIPVDEWAALLCLFFRGNPLVHEYLAGSTEPSDDRCFGDN